MKKSILAFSFLAVIGTTAFSQNIKWGVQAGAAIASQTAKQKEGEISITSTSDSKVGFTLGVLSDISITDNLTFQPGLNFTQKGGKFSDSDGELTQTLNYVDLPLNFLYNAPAGKGKFFAGLGPVVNYGISGKFKMTMTGEPEVSEDVNFGNKVGEDNYKPFEFAGNVLAGYECSNGLFVAANYNVGLSNIAVGGDSDNSIKNRHFGVKLGFKFGGAAAK